MDLLVERTFSVSIERMFEVWTNPDLVRRWFFVGEHWQCEAENDLRVGGTFTLAMKDENGQPFTCSGVYLELEYPRRIAFTWNSHLHIGSVVTVELTESGAGTALRLTHSRLPDDDSREAHRKGWIGCLDNLDRVLGAPGIPLGQMI